MLNFVIFWCHSCEDWHVYPTELTSEALVRMLTGKTDFLFLGDDGLSVTNMSPWDLLARQKAIFDAVHKFIESM